MAQAATVTDLHPNNGPSARTWAAHYTPEDQAAAQRIALWLEASPERSITSLARLAGVVRGTLSMCLSGTYTSSPTEQLRLALAAIESATDRESEVVAVPYVAGSVHQMLGVAIRRARTYRSVVVFAGDVGTGKTRAARELARSTAQLTLIEATGEMSTSDLLAEIGTSLELSLAPGASAAARLSAIVRKLKGSVHVLMIDEADTLAAPHRRDRGVRSLEALRRIRDLAEVGLVLIGTPAIDDVIGRGVFDQLRSRTNLRPETVRGVPREDIEAVARAALADQGEAVTLDVLNALWRAAGGRQHKDTGAQTRGASMRVLVEGLLPGLRDFGLARGKDLSPALVRAVAKQALGLSVED
ncbi:ATP-binding protein [uncultured Thiodictyon sp.]|uniref:ATP-binding protein n=1 Tax=uncultured Thiodictyon sp. TaxID=1846217 RepID=UPI0025CC4F3E|nr:ATP-binding protein [uncultured Thiodictyon sp.]